jgi:riboflavin synthase
MFTGIVSGIGEVRAVEKRGDTHIVIAPPFDPAVLAMGASIACAGCCLTVFARDAETFTVTASAETLAHTTLGTWKPGTRVNLERPLHVGDELGGHIVTGHVDGVAELTGVAREGESFRMTFAAPVDLARFIVPKGSVALNGVSLTVNEADGARFGVNIIPHTLKVTTFGGLKPGARVNLEIDVIARYVARLAQGSWAA